VRQCDISIAVVARQSEWFTVSPLRVLLQFTSRWSFHHSSQCWYSSPSITRGQTTHDSSGLTHHIPTVLAGLVLKWLNGCGM